MTIHELVRLAKTIEVYEVLRSAECEIAAEAAAEVISAFGPLRGQIAGLALDRELQREMCKALSLLAGATVPSSRLEVERALADVRIELVERLLRRSGETVPARVA